MAAMTGDLTIQHARLVLPDRCVTGDIVVRDGSIEAIGPRLTETAGEVIDGTGLVCMPGVVDARVHFREPGLTHKEDLRTGSRAAAAGGVTSFLDMPDTQPTTTTLEALRAKRAMAAEQCVVNYGFFIGAVFSGVIGVGFYPLMGSRVWCRFGCPQAAILGIFQRFFSRFRITTNGGQCISCGNCSTYCEMGIDVRAYAQRGDNIVRASCVGCGVCSEVCPRGVLKLENGSFADRFRNAGKPFTAFMDALRGRPKNG